LDSNADKFYDGHPRRRRQVLCTSLDYSRRPDKVSRSHRGRDEGSFDIHARTARPVDQSAPICADWVKIFFATLWIPRGWQYIEFMFRGDRHRLYREQIVDALGVDLVPTTQVHELCYPGAVPPCRSLAGGMPPPNEIVSVLFRQPFSPDSLRSPGELSQLAAVLLLTFKKLLSLVLGHTPFDLVDLLICEWEDWIADGLKGKKRIPYAHVICYLLAKTVGFLE